MVPRSHCYSKEWWRCLQVKNNPCHVNGCVPPGSADSQPSFSLQDLFCCSCLVPRYHWWLFSVLSWNWVSSDTFWLHVVKGEPGMPQNLEVLGEYPVVYACCGEHSQKCWGAVLGYCFQWLFFRSHCRKRGKMNFRGAGKMRLPDELLKLRGFV